MRIAVGSDRRGMEMRDGVLALLNKLGQEVIEVGGNHEHLDYLDVAALVARKVSSGEVERGILIGGFGLGMCIVANKFPGVRAAPCHDDISAEISRRHNDLNVLCLSREILGDRAYDRLVELWVKTEFDGGRHARRLQKIHQIEKRARHK